MKRRDLLLGGAASLGVASGEAGAATAPTPKFDAAAVEAMLAKIDHRMASFSEMDFAPRPPLNAEEEELFGTRTRVSRAALRTLYFTGAFMELEEHERLHPGVQARMARLQPEMDEAVDGMTTYLEKLTPEDHRKLQEELKRDPELSLRIGEQLQSVAKEDGMGFSRRMDLRVAIDDVTRRMTAQNPSLVFDPYVRKTRKIQANPGTIEERERAIQIRAGEKAFWDFQQRSAAHVLAWDEAYSTRPRIDLASLEHTYPDVDAPPLKDDPTEKPRKVMRVGGYLMGAGFGTAALGGIFYLIGAAVGPAASGGFFTTALVLGVTIGPALLIAGLIVLIVGGIWYAVVKP
jgi:hypothetical protein